LNTRLSFARKHNVSRRYPRVLVGGFLRKSHAGLVLDALIGRTHPDCKRRLGRWAKRPLTDKVQALSQETRKACLGQPQAAAVEQALGYFVRSFNRMQYVVSHPGLQIEHFLD
jgi:hypothetical protein